MAKALIESLADTFDPSRYKDEYREAVMKVVQAKVEGEVIEAPPTPQPAKVMDGNEIRTWQAGIRFGCANPRPRAARTC